MGKPMGKPMDKPMGKPMGNLAISYFLKHQLECILRVVIVVEVVVVEVVVVVVVVEAAVVVLVGHQGEAEMGDQGRPSLGSKHELTISVAGASRTRSVSREDSKRLCSRSSGNSSSKARW